MSSLPVAVTEEIASKLVGVENVLSSCHIRGSNSGVEQVTDPEGPPFRVCPDNGVDGRIGYRNANLFSMRVRCWWSSRCMTGHMIQCQKIGGITSPRKIRRKCDRWEPRNNWRHPVLNAGRSEKGSKVGRCQDAGLCYPQVVEVFPIN